MILLFLLFIFRYNLFLASSKCSTVQYKSLTSFLSSPPLSFLSCTTDESHWTSKAAPAAPGPQGTGSSELLGEVAGADVIIIDDIVGK